MAKYLLSTHARNEADTDTADGGANTAADAQAAWRRLQEVEADMKATGAWFFSGRLHDPATATVVHRSGDEVIVADGPFAETKEHIAGFYIVEAPDLDAALAWAGRVTACIGAPIEVWPFAHSAH